MLDKLFDLVKSLAGDTVVNNPDIPNEHNDDVVAEATHTVASGFQNMIAGGGLQNILSLFGGGGNQQQSTSKGLLSNPIVNMMIGHFASKLMSKFGLGGNQANSVSSNLIPNVISGLINKTNDPSNNGFSLDGLLHMLTGGQSTQVAQEQPQTDDSGSGGGFNFQNLINQFTGGGGTSSGGGGGISDILSKITSGAQNAMQGQGGGGLMDMIKGFIK